MPVTFTVASHPANQWLGWQLNTAEAILEEACNIQYENCKQVLRSSLKSEELSKISPSGNGFVHAVLDAWAGHFHLRIRPDDVWVAILNQLNFYINAHGEELRRYFVAHDGKKALILTSTGGDFAAFARKMSLKIRENVVDSTLVEWILPDFTTTTLHDRAVCSVVMMASLKQYFSYGLSETCGIPTVTLEGEKSDWEELYRRLGRLYELGDEPSVWAEMLRPILCRFVRAFDGDPDVTFWEHVVHRNTQMCGQDDLSGWLTAFCVWDHKGRWKPFGMPDVIPTKPAQEHTNMNNREKPSIGERSGLGRFVTKLLNFKKAGQRLEDVEKIAAHQEPTQATESRMSTRGRFCEYTLDGVAYFTIPTSEVPAGYCEVDVTLLHDEHKTYCTMIAGHFAISVAPKESGGKLDTLSPAPHWMIFEKKLHLEDDEA
ncbi:hypothetical protein OH76DRAFT_1552446 [Lentinus brumalis]|uniref:Uncharacterized protein n=1 Tax=Lentinus brumalis TaxID=2498619 RepID=A0A371DRS5_9APHY|nr:hypothetical protein OH76DRAFT_1552446 [Polyporus brumalis]